MNWVPVNQRNQKQLQNSGVLVYCYKYCINIIFLELLVAGSVYNVCMAMGVNLDLCPGGLG